MMSKELLKKAGIIGVSFGLMASPLAFAQTDENSAIDENQGITVDEQPLDPQGADGTGAQQSTDALVRDEGDVVRDGDSASKIEPNSSSHSDNADYDKDDLVEENDGTN